jgi:hypothetical protein
MEMGMMRRPAAGTSLAGILAMLWVCLTATPCSVASEFDEVMRTGTDRVLVAQASQERIDEVVLETQDLESEFKQIMKQIDGLQVYNDYIQRQIENQDLELETLRTSLGQVDVVERQIMPLMIRMLDGLDQFIQLDIPFLIDDRMARVERLRLLMERADVSMAEKFRRLTEAFQIENEFGRTIETYKDALVLGGANLEVNVLRLGRIGLYFQTNDASMTGKWDPGAGNWTELTDGLARNQVRQGIRMARKLVAPDLLLLEVQAPEVAP